MNTESQPLLHHEVPSPEMRALVPIPLLLTLVLLPFLLLPHIFNYPAPVTSEATRGHASDQRMRAHARNDSLRLLSMNMFIRPRLLGWADYKDERLDELFEIFKQRDLLCVQELFWTTGRRKTTFLEKLDAYFPYAAHAPKPGLGAFFHYPPKPIDAGLAILSKRRIVNVEFHMYSVSAWNSVDWLVAKGVLYAGIEVLSGIVHVFTTHMQAGDFPGVRETQVTELVTFVKSIVKDDGVIVIAGDFNINGRNGIDDDRESLEYKKLMRAVNVLGVVDVVKEMLGQVVTTAGGLSGKTQKNERIDYLLLAPGSNGLVASVRDGDVRVEELVVSGKPYRTLSDHYAIVAEIMVGVDERKSR